MNNKLFVPLLIIYFVLFGLKNSQASQLYGENEIYITGSVGKGSYENICNFNLCDSNTLTGKFGLGYALFDNLSLTVDYRYLGDSKYYSDDVTNSISTNAFTFGGKANLPLTEYLNVTGIFGGGFFFQDKIPSDDVDNSTYFSNYFGVGLDYELSRQWKVNLDYTYYKGNSNNLKGDFSIRPNMSELSFGISYYFSNNNEVKKISIKEIKDVKLDNPYIVFPLYNRYPSSLEVDNDNDQFSFVYDYLMQNPNYKVTIIGHTDSEGSSLFNYDLAMKRAEELANYLMNRGINRTRLVVESKGETNPIASNKTLVGRMKNRRIEVLFHERY